MKSNKLLMLLAIAGIAALLPAPASAERDNDNNQDKPKDKQERGKSEFHRQDNKASQGNAQPPHINLSPAQPGE